MKNKKGISLIVLSITILVMAILAATAIIALEDSGIINRSRNTVGATNYSEEYTRLTVVKNALMTDKLGTITVDEYVTELLNKGIIEGEGTANGDGSKTVTTKTGFSVTVSPKDGYDVEIEMTSTTPITFTIEGTTYTARTGMTWKTWCASNYNNAGLVCLAGTRIIKYDIATTKLAYVLSVEQNGTSFTMTDVYGSDVITAGKSYSFGSTTGTNFVLKKDKTFTSVANTSYTTYGDIANAIKNGEILGAVCPGGLFDSYNECYSNFKIYVKANGTLQAAPLEYSTVIMSYKAGDAITLTLTGVPTTTKWYRADASHQPTGSALATGTSYAYPYEGKASNVDLVIVYTN